MARYLAEAGGKVQVVLTAPEEQLGELPLAQLKKLRLRLYDRDVMPWSDGFVFPGSESVIIDALLGTQAAARCGVWSRKSSRK